MDKLKTLANEQLAEYLEQNIHDFSAYEIRNESLKSLLSTAGAEPNVQLYKGLRWSNVIDGIVGLEVNRTVCLYDFTRNKICGYRKAYSDEPIDVTLLYIFYGEYLDRILALEQYKRGLAPPVYAETAKLSQFLNGKKSVKLIMKDGSMYEYKHHNGNEVCVSNLLHFNRENIAEPFSLEDSYDLRPQFNANRPLCDLDYLQYGREKYFIDMDALKQFGAPEQI
jgi:hypothetical protein